MTEIERELALILIENVEGRKMNITYQEAAKELEKRIGQPVNAHLGLRYPLEAIARACASLDLPIITVRVVRSNGTNGQLAGAGFYKIACELKPHYKTMPEAAVWNIEKKLVRSCTDWDKLRAYYTMPPSGSQQSISTCPSSPDDPKDRNLGLDENSIDINNAYIVSQISQEMERKGVISAPLDMLNVVELDLAMDTIMHNTHFKKMDVKYGSLLSRALKRFRYDRNTNVTVTDHRAQELEIQDTTLSQTEREAIVLSRIGQGLFRKKLLDKYQGRCIITGINQPRLLVASHIKPWAASNNLERLSVDNGLLLSATYDRLFDSGLITFHSSGKLYLSSSLDPENAARLHLCEGYCYALMTTNKMIQFLEYHADCIFLK